MNQQNYFSGVSNMCKVVDTPFILDLFLNKTSLNDEYSKI